MKSVALGKGGITAEPVATYIICKCIDDDEPVTNIHLQKMLYILQSDALHTCGNPLFDDEFIVGIWGPEIHAIYHKFSLWGGSAINRKPEKMLPLLELISDDEARRMDSYIEVLRKLRPWEMPDVVHGLWQLIEEGELIPLPLIAQEELPVLSNMRSARCAHGSSRV